MFFLCGNLGSCWVYFLAKFEHPVWLYYTQSTLNPIKGMFLQTGGKLKKKLNLSLWYCIGGMNTERYSLRWRFDDDVREHCLKASAYLMWRLYLWGMKPTFWAPNLTSSLWFRICRHAWVYQYYKWRCELFPGLD